MHMMARSITLPSAPRATASIRPIFDPIQGRETYVGTQIVQAARIEPVTEPGMIYVTEAFAAALALIRGAPFARDYLSEVDTGKSHGRLPPYAPRAAIAGDCTCQPAGRIRPSLWDTSSP
jgi:hypothetical protein